MGDWRHQAISLKCLRLGFCLLGNRRFAFFCGITGFWSIAERCYRTDSLARAFKTRYVEDLVTYTC